MESALISPVIRFEFRSGPFSTDKKVTVVKSCFYTVGEVHDVGLSLTNRDPARLAISAAQESPWAPSTAPVVFRVGGCKRSRFARLVINAAQEKPRVIYPSPGVFVVMPHVFGSPRTLPAFSVRSFISQSRIHAAYCRLIAGFVLAFPGPWLAHPRASSEYSPEG